MRLDNSSALEFGEENVLAVRADASFGSGHWYEGGGLNRGVTLAQSSLEAQFVKHGVFVAPSVAAASGPADITSSVEVELAMGSDNFQVDITVTDDATSEVVAKQKATVSASPAAATIQAVNMSLSAADLRRWSIGDPAMYSVSTTSPA